MALPAIDLEKLTALLLAATDLIDQAQIEWCLFDALGSGLDELEGNGSEDQDLQLNQVAWLRSEVDERIGRRALPEIKRLIEQSRGMLVRQTLADLSHF